VTDEKKRGIKALKKSVYKVVFGFNDFINESIEFPADYYESTPDLKANLTKFVGALEKIRAKYDQTPDSKQLAEDEVSLANCICHFRAGNYSLELLEKAVKLEGIYGTR
jgi:cytochrome c556